MALATLVTSTVALESECQIQYPNGPMLVTADCIDPDYNQPIINSKTFKNSTTPYTLYSGHFEGTTVDFNIYFPGKSNWDGRFFQTVYPSFTKDAEAETIAFGVESGAYTVQITGTIGYRADAAAAKFSKVVAADFYGEPSRRIYGYVYGASGGSYQTAGAMENTEGVWDGGIPIVQAVPVSIPNNWATRALGGLVLRNKSSEIQEAVRPGGSGDVLSILSDTEKAVWLEVTKMGIPERAWENFNVTANTTDLVLLMNIPQGQDPTYVDDFWSKTGYLGTENSELGDIFRAAKVDHGATIKEVDIPADLDTTGIEFNLLGENQTTIGSFGGSLNGATLVLSDGNTARVLKGLVGGAKVRLDNRWYLALHAFHRYQVPLREGFYGFDQFLDADGQPIYPQRDVEVAKAVAISSSGGGTHTGKIRGKVIVIDALLDVDAFPWHADWYRSQVKVALGDEFDDNFRLWYNDNADHGHPGIGHSGTWRVTPTGLYNQALRFLSAWAEDGIPPPSSTIYEVSDSQVVLPKSAVERRGIQPVITLEVNASGGSSAGIGEQVGFEAIVDVPPDAGEVVSIEWDFNGTGEFTEPSMDNTALYTYHEAGTYIPTVRVTTKVDISSAFALMPNLGRTSVTVS
ncbi:hypothetical protein MGN70_007192 [Eutypa lata]|nr:hypothetical protein MGN70_007192 [Eutypa lata]